jgi:predicted permease
LLRRSKRGRPSFSSASRTELAGELNAGARGSSEGNFRNQTRSALVAAEVAVSLVLLIGAGLLLKSFARMEAVRPGFDPSNVLTMRLSLPKTRYPSRESIVNFYRDLAPRIAALPGVRAATATNALPLTQGLASVEMSIMGRSWNREQLPEILYRMASPSYFRTLGVPLLTGRDFTEFDTATSSPVAIINETLARRYWTSENPVGAHVSIDDNGPVLREVEIVGIAGDIHDNGLDNPALAQIFIPLPQVPDASIIYFRGGMYWAVRTDHDPLALAGAVRSEIRRLDPEVASAGTLTLDQYLERSVGPRRFNLLLLGVFAVAALVLAVSGIYAVVAFSVTRRTREIGIRVALGAQRGDLLRMILGQGLRLVLAGLAAGLLGSLLVTRVLKGMLYGVSATDAATFAGVALLLAATALAACYIPARRATRVDPLVALRYE